MVKTTFPNHIEKLADIFKALSHPIRLKIAMGLITKDDCNVNSMVEKLNIPQPTVSQHLTILKNAGIIEGYRKGNQVCYKLMNQNVKVIITSILQENK